MSPDTPSGANRTDLVLCWHMHQPEYRDTASGNYLRPWSYLHGIKDYTDMVAVIETVPEARAVINFSPTLLEQIEDYAARLRAYLEHGTALPDPVLAWLAADHLPGGADVRRDIATQGLRANAQRMIERFPAYGRLAALARQALTEPTVFGWLADQFYFDLLVWHHLAWCGESLRRTDPRIAALMEREAGFDRSHRRSLLAAIADTLAGIIPRYRALAEAGRVELSVTPYSHPILPLLLDLASGREAVPDLPLPHAHYPGGAERTRWQLDAAKAVFERCFGRAPVGCWPSEGALSEASLELIAAAGFQWTASGQQVLQHSITPAGDGACIHHTYRLGKLPTLCFFRDDGLSDKIGFEYQSWRAEDAVADLVHHLEAIDRTCRDRKHRVIAIILDGENCWEHYPHNGDFFLPELYRTLGQHPSFNLTTFADSAAAIQPVPLPKLVAGSWVYGTLTTWIGDPDKNRAWELLCAAKVACDQVLTDTGLDADRRRAIEHQLALCEASDWCWWFGDYNPAESVAEFDQLFRGHLRHLYRLLDQAEPPELATPLFQGGGAPELGGVMRRGRNS